MMRVSSYHKKRGDSVETYKPLAHAESYPSEELQG